ncbi:unnamed protein product, partial [Mycena citricolor]
ITSWMLIAPVNRGWINETNQCPVRMLEDHCEPNDVIKDITGQRFPFVFLDPKSKNFGAFVRTSSASRIEPSARWHARIILVSRLCHDLLCCHMASSSSYATASVLG